MLRKLWRVATRNQVRTWWVHAAISCLIGGIFAPWGIDAVSKALWVVALCYFVKEVLDIFKHMAYATRAFDGQGVSPRIDFHGDIVGPTTAAVVGQICAWITPCP